MCICIYVHVNYQQLYCIVAYLHCCRLRHGLDDQRIKVWLPAWKNIFLFSSAFRPVLRPKQPSVKSLLGLLLRW